MHFLAHHISAHRGCCAPKILHAQEIDQALIAHTRSGTGVPPPQKNSNRENLKLDLKFSVDQLQTLPGWTKETWWTLVHIWKSYRRAERPHQGYLAHAPTGTGVPPKKNRENLKFGLKFSVWAAITSMPVGISSPNFYRRRDELWSTYKRV